MRTRKAFTLAESMIATVVLATAVVSVSAALSAAHQQNTHVRERSVLLQVGKSLMEEVASLPFTPSATANGWLSGVSNRTQYDDVFDFAGYTDASPFTSAQGTGSSLDVGAGYSRTVTVQPLATPATAAATAAAANFALAKVKVTAPGGNSVTLEQWFSRATLKR